jgi:Zn-dependent protease with chaperone function
VVLPVEGYRLENISPKSYEHPADRAASAALSSIPYLDSVVRKLIEFGYERALRQSLLGASVRLGGDQLPDVWHLHNGVYATLDMTEVPALYITQAPTPNALTIGAGQPVVVLQSELVRLLDADQLHAVLAHEAGHVLSDHVLYQTALVILLRLGQSARLPLGLLPLRAALLEWSRASELTCDRAAALATRNPMAVCRALMTITAGAEASRLDLDAFMRQGMDYREKGTGLERLSRLLLDLNVTHALPVRRVHELTSWVQGGDYDRIVGGEYVTRDEPVHPRVEAGEAASHYAERFRELSQEAGESISDAIRELGDWLRGGRGAEKASGEQR